MMILSLFCLLLAVGEVSAQRELPGQVGIGIQGGTVDGFLLRDG